MNREHEGAVRGSPTARDGGAYRACRAVVPVARIQPRPSLTEPPGGVSPRTEAVPTRLWGGARRTGVPRRGKGVLVPHKGERPTAPYPRNHTRSIQTWVGSVSPHNGCGFDEYLARGRSRIPWVRSAIRRIEIQHTTGSTEMRGSGASTRRVAWSSRLREPNHAPAVLSHRERRPFAARL